MIRLIIHFTLCCLLFFLVSFGRAQIVPNTNIYYTPANSFVGIGTSTPLTQLHVSGNIAAASDANLSGFVQMWGDNAVIWKAGNVNAGLRFGSSTDLSAGGWSEKMRITDGGFVGIGTTSPASLLEVKTPAPLSAVAGSTAELARFSTTTGNYSQLKILFNRYIFDNGLGWQSASTRIQAFTDASAQAFIDFNPNGAPAGMAFGASNAEAMRINLVGNILIGQTTQTNTGYKLDVNGSARMTRIVVNTTGADYVFDSTYQLKPLQVVERYITANHHLPDVASAAQMKTEGLDVGENQTVLLKKIEELTLYVIQQQQQIETQNKEMQNLRTEMEILKRSIKNK